MIQKLNSLLLKYRPWLIYADTLAIAFVLGMTLG